MSESKKINAWVAVDKDGSEFIYTNKLDRDTKEMMMWLSTGDGCIPLPKGSIKRLTGLDLTFEDEPVELKEPVSPCIDCECAKFADEVIKPSPSLSIYNALKEIKRYGIEG